MPCAPLNSEDLANVLLACGNGPAAPRTRLAIALGCTTGFRASELLSLSIDDVFRSGKPRAHVAVARRNMKGSRRGRVAVLPSFVHPYLESWLRVLRRRGRANNQSPLFQSRKGAGKKSISYVQLYRDVRRALDNTSIDPLVPGTHTMRKTFAAEFFAAADRDLWLTQQALGHIDARSTVAYLQTDDAEVERITLDAWNPKPSALLSTKLP